MFGKIEVLFIFFIIIGISAFIGLNVIKAVEKKINNMKVSIPEPKVSLIIKTGKGDCNVSCIQQSKDHREQPSEQNTDQVKSRANNQVTKRTVEQVNEQSAKQLVRQTTEQIDSNTTDEMNEIRNIMSKNVNYYDEDDVLTDTINKVYKSTIKAFNESDYAHN
jgi:hypothetical protein